MISSNIGDRYLVFHGLFYGWPIFSCKAAQVSEKQCKRDSLGAPLKYTLRKSVKNRAKTR